MPVIKCCDCGKGRHHTLRGARPLRCKPCAVDWKRQQHRDWIDERRRKKLCLRCGEKLNGHSIAHCDSCGGYHAGYQAHAMREKRGADPEYRADEREKVKARMRRARADLRKKGLSNRGRPYKTAKVAAYAARLMLAPREPNGIA